MAYQTAYLKAHYPAEYMAAVMTSGQSDIKRTTELMDDCRKHGLEILAPSVNESEMDFSVNSKGQIRFGLQAISGMGEAAAEAIISEREEHGPYSDIFDFLERVDVRSVNRKNIEVLVKAGAFDGVGEMHRAQYFYKENDNEMTPTFLEKLVRWAVRNRENAESSQMSLFDVCDEMKTESRPQIPQCEPWSVVEQCREELSVIGLYMSGHPLDNFKYEMQYYVKTNCADLTDLSKYVNQEVTLGGVVTQAMEGKMRNNGDPFGQMTIEDYTGSYSLSLYRDEFLKFKNYFQKDLFVLIKGHVRQFSRINPDGSVQKYKPTLKITKMMMLTNVLAENTRQVSFNIDLSCISHEFCKEFAQLVKKHKGSVPLEATVVDAPRNLTLTMKSNTQKVDAREFMPLLEQMKGVSNVKPVAR